MLFQVLGPLRIWDGARWSLLPAAQQRVVLAVLLANVGRVVSADQLIDEIWGTEPPRSALATVQVYVSRLRKMLGWTVRGPLLTFDRGYQLTIDDDDIDAQIFDGLVAAGRREIAAGRLDGAVEQLSRALALWRGPALADVPTSPMVGAETMRLERGRLSAMEERFGALLQLRRHADIVDELQAVVRQHPMRERLWAQLMRALYQSGRRGEALAAYREARGLLVAELGLEPGPELRDTHRAVLDDDPRLAVPAAPVKPDRVVPAQLPADVAGFTGRETELGRLDALVDESTRACERRQGDKGGGPEGLGGGKITAPTAMVVCAVAGTAGVGKTALAVHWAHRVRDRFPDGQLYVNLRGYASGAPLRPIEALARFLTAVGVRAERVPAQVDEAAALFRSLVTGRRMLILLDNANHPDQVRPLLPGEARCLVVVTSRDRLDGLVARDGAARVTLDVLRPPESRRLLTRIVGADRIDAEPEAVAELARLCGHLPLALRIAGAHLSSRPAATIGGYAAELSQGDRLAALAVPEDPRAAVRVALDQSCALLDEPARRMFGLLGLVPGADVTAPVAAGLADTGTPEAEELLDGLAAAHLIEEHAPGRYAFHDLLRHYAVSIAGPAVDGARERLYAHWLHSAAAAADLVYPQMLRAPSPPALDGCRPRKFGDDVQAAEWLEAESANLIATVRDAADREHHETVWRLADALRGYFLLSGRGVEWLAVANIGLVAARADGDPRAQATAHHNLATRAWAVCQFPTALAEYESMLDLARRAGWAEGESSALGNLGTAYFNLGRLDDAEVNISAGLAIDRRTGWAAGQAFKLSNLGLVHRARGRLEAALRCQVEALGLCRGVRSRSGEARVLSELGLLHLDLGRFDEAQTALVEALTIHRQLGDRTAEGGTLGILAAVHRDRGRLRQGLDVATAAVTLARDVDDQRLEGDALVVRAEVRSRLGDHTNALADSRLALERARQAGDGYVEAEALVGLAAGYRWAGEPGPALGHLEVALAAARDRGYRLVEGQALTGLAALRLDRDEAARAAELAGQALAIHAETGHRLGQARAHLIAEEALGRAGRAVEARTHRDAARRILTTLGLDPADQVAASAVRA